MDWQRHMASTLYLVFSTSISAYTPLPWKHPNQYMCIATIMKLLSKSTSPRPPYILKTPSGMTSLFFQPFNATSNRCTHTISSFIMSAVIRTNSMTDCSPCQNDSILTVMLALQSCHTPSRPYTNTTPLDISGASPPMFG